MTRSLGVPRTGPGGRGGPGPVVPPDDRLRDAAPQDLPAHGLLRVAAQDGLDARDGDGGPREVAAALQDRPPELVAAPPHRGEDLEAQNVSSASPNG